MSDGSYIQPPGWYHAKGDSAGTQRYWDGNAWQGGPQPVPGGAVSEDVVIAEPVQRIFARVIDGLIWVVISVAVAIPIGVVTGLTDIGNWLGVVGEILAGLLIVLYEVWMVAARGGTVGKLALGLRVVHADGADPDQTIGVETAARRMALLAVHSVLRPFGALGALVFVGLALAGLVMLFVDPKRQTPWDKVGKTIVQDV